MKPLPLAAFITMQILCGIALWIGIEMHDDGINVGYLHFAILTVLPFLGYVVGMAHSMFAAD